MSNEYVQLRHLCAEIDIGTTSRTICPWCLGGNTGEKSFAVTRFSEAEAKYICHRASCHKSGRIAVWGFRLRQNFPTSNPDTQSGKKFTPRLYTGDTQELGIEWSTELLERYGLRKDEAVGNGWRVESSSGRLVVPVRSPLGLVRGIELRRSKDQVPIIESPKTDSYRVLEEPWLGWYRDIEVGTIVLVEDAISALKVSRQFEVACLHGSHISEEMLLEIIGISGVNREVVVALDADATAKAIKFVSQWRFIAPNFRMVALSKDLKYSTNEEINQIILR